VSQVVQVALGRLYSHWGCNSSCARDPPLEGEEESRMDSPTFKEAAVRLPLLCLSASSG